MLVPFVKRFCFRFRLGLNPKQNGFMKEEVVAVVTEESCGTVVTLRWSALISVRSLLPPSVTVTDSVTVKDTRNEVEKPDTEPRMTRS